jgi:hypothetical protein
VTVKVTLDPDDVTVRSVVVQLRRGEALRGDFGDRAKLEERMAPGVRHVLLESVIDADAQAREDADGWPETWPEDDSEDHAKEARSPVRLERAFEDRTRLVGRELDGLDRYPAAAWIREGRLAIGANVGDPAGLTVGRLHEPATVELEQAQRYRSKPAGPATAHREQHVRGTGRKPGRDQATGERVEQAEESPGHPIAEIQPAGSEMIIHEENTNRCRRM